MKFFTSLFIFLIGFGLVYYTHVIVNFFGRMDWAERRFGSTSTFWKLFGVGLIAYAMAHLFGVI